MRQTISLLAMIALMLPIGLFALSAPVEAATVLHHRKVHHRVVSHRVIHHTKHAAVHRVTHVSAG